MDKTLELRREDEIDHGEGEGEDKEDRAGRVAEVERFPFVADDGRFGELFPDDAVEGIERFAERIALGKVRFDRDGADAVVAVQGARVGKFAQAHEVREGDELTALPGSHEEILKIAGGAFIIPCPFDDDVVFLAFVGEGGDPPRAEESLQRRPDGLDGDAEIGRAGAVDIDAELGFALLIIVVDPCQSGVLPGLFKDNVAPPGKSLVLGPADDKLHLFLQSGRETLPHDREMLHPREIGEFAPDLGHDDSGGAASRPVVEVHDGDDLVVVEGRSESARHPYEKPLRLARLGQIHEPLFNLHRHVERVAVARSLGCFADDEKGAPVLLWNELGRDRLEEPEAGKKDPEDGETREPGEAHEAMQDPAVDRLEFYEDFLHGAGEPVRPGDVVAAEELRGDHGTQGQGDEA